MARKKKDPAQEATPAPIQEAQEQTTSLQEQEAHLDPEQLRGMDDDNLRRLAQDMGLDPDACGDRETLIAAIAAVPVIPGPPDPEAEADPEAPTPEIAQSQDQAPEPEPLPAPAQEKVTPAQETQAPQEAPTPTPELFTPYEATVAVPLVVIRRGKTPRPKDKPIGTMARGARVTVTASIDGYAMLANGTYVKEAYLERKE